MQGDLPEQYSLDFIVESDRIDFPIMAYLHDRGEASMEFLNENGIKMNYATIQYQAVKYYFQLMVIPETQQYYYKKAFSIGLN